MLSHVTVLEKSYMSNKCIPSVVFARMLECLSHNNETLNPDMHAFTALASMVLHSNFIADQTSIVETMAA